MLQCMPFGMHCSMGTCQVCQGQPCTGQLFLIPITSSCCVASWCDAACRPCAVTTAFGQVSGGCIRGALAKCLRTSSLWYVAFTCFLPAFTLHALLDTALSVCAWHIMCCNQSAKGCDNRFHPCLNRWCRVYCRGLGTVRTRCICSGQAANSLAAIATQELLPTMTMWGALLQGGDNFAREFKQLRRSFRFNEYKSISDVNPPRNFLERVSDTALLCCAVLCCAVLCCAAPAHCVSNTFAHTVKSSLHLPLS